MSGLFWSYKRDLRECEAKSVFDLEMANKHITKLEAENKASQIACDRLQLRIAELEAEIERMRPVMEAAKAYKATFDELIRLYDAEEDFNTAMWDREQAEQLLFLTVCNLEDKKP